MSDPLAGPPPWAVTSAEAQQALSAVPEPFAVLLRHGTMSVELYAPVGADRQTPHEQDEIYIVASGTGVFSKAGERRSFGPGDVLFVEAGVEHRFEEFSTGFSTWVVFWGPKGGEAA
jgi:mannose-6-phosphate isomerase-like protein (cupin superfamily)